MPIATSQKLDYHAKRAAGITHGKGIHPLRHAFATHRLAAGYDIRTVQECLRHQDVSTTMLYTYVYVRHRGRCGVMSPADLLETARSAGQVSGGQFAV